MLVNFRNLVLQYTYASKLANARSIMLDHISVLSVSIFRKYWIFCVENSKFLKIHGISSELDIELRGTRVDLTETL